MISSNAPPDKVRVPTQVSDLVSQGGSSGHWADTNPPWGGNSSQEVVTVPRGVERGSDTTSSWPLAHGGQAVGSTAEAQVRGGAVGGVLASGSTAIPVAVGLMAHVGATFLHPVFPRRGAFRVERVFSRMVHAPPVRSPLPRIPHYIV